MVPSTIFQSDSVHALIEAAEYVMNEHNALFRTDDEVDGNDDFKKKMNLLLSDLKVANRVRKRIAAEKYKGGDEGHSYFIDVLTYCWSVLSPIRRKMLLAARNKSNDKSTNQHKDEVPMPNRFAKLSFPEDVNEEEDMEEDLPQGPQPRP